MLYVDPLTYGNCEDSCEYNTLHMLAVESAHTVQTLTVMRRNKFHFPSTIKVPLSEIAEPDYKSNGSHEVVYCRNWVTGQKIPKAKGHAH